MISMAGCKKFDGVYDLFYLIKILKFITTPEPTTTTALITTEPPTTTPGYNFLLRM
jgi:hypothetical protein